MNEHLFSTWSHSQFRDNGIMLRIIFMERFFLVYLTVDEVWIRCRCYKDYFITVPYSIECFENISEIKYSSYSFLFFLEYDYQIILYATFALVEKPCLLLVNYLFWFTDSVLSNAKYRGRNSEIVKYAENLGIMFHHPFTKRSQNTSHAVKLYLMLVFLLLFFPA